MPAMPVDAMKNGKEQKRRGGKKERQRRAGEQTTLRPAWENTCRLICSECPHRCSIVAVEKRKKGTGDRGDGGQRGTEDRGGHGTDGEDGTADGWG